MFNSKKKGQISVEALIIVGVLVIGGIIFAAVFLGQISNNKNKANELSGITDEFIGDLGWGPTIGPGPGPTTPTCSDGIQNQGELGVDCGGPHCDPCEEPPMPGYELTLNLSLDPNSPSQINTDFSVIAKIINRTEEENPVIKEINIKKYNAVLDRYDNTNNCSFNGGEYKSTYTDEIPFSSETLNLKFTCNAIGSYSITVKAGIKDSDVDEHNDEVSKIKNIIPTQNFSVNILSPINGIYYIDNPMLLNSELSGDIDETTAECTWVAIDRTADSLTSTPIVISYSCNDIITPSNIDLFEISHKYNIYLSVKNRDTQELVNAEPVEILIIDHTISQGLYFNPEKSTIVNTNFTTTYLTETQVDEGSESLSLKQTNGSDCEFTRIRGEVLDTYNVVNPITGESNRYYGYNYDSICRMSGTKTIKMEIKQGTNVIRSIQENYNIISTFLPPTIGIELYLDDSGIDGTTAGQDSDLLLSGKKEDTLYFAGEEEYINYKILQGQKFFIRAVVDNTENLSNEFCQITFTSRISPLFDVKTYDVPCNVGIPLRFSETGIYDIKATAQTGINQINANKIIEFIETPFYITSIHPNNEYKYVGDILLDIYFVNSSGNAITIDMNLYKKLNTGDEIISELEPKTNDFKLNFAGEEESGYQIYGPTLNSFNCNTNYTNCNKTITITEPGEYYAKIIATSNSNNQIEFISFNVVNQPTGATIISSDHVNLGQSLTVAGWLNYTIGGQTYLYPPKTCSWGTNPTSVELTSGCVIQMTPEDLVNYNIGLSASDGITTKHTTKTISVPYCHNLFAETNLSTYWYMLNESNNVVIPFNYELKCRLQDDTNYDLPTDRYADYNIVIIKDQILHTKNNAEDKFLAYLFSEPSRFQSKTDGDPATSEDIKNLNLTVIPYIISTFGDTNDLEDLNIPAGELNITTFYSGQNNIFNFGKSELGLHSINIFINPTSEETIEYFPEDIEIYSQMIYILDNNLSMSTALSIATNPNNGPSEADLDYKVTSVVARSNLEYILDNLFSPEPDNFFKQQWKYNWSWEPVDNWGTIIENLGIWSSWSVHPNLDSSFLVNYGVDPNDPESSYTQNTEIISNLSSDFNLYVYRNNLIKGGRPAHGGLLIATSVGAEIMHNPETDDYIDLYERQWGFDGEMFGAYQDYTHTSNINADTAGGMWYWFGSNGIAPGQQSYPQGSYEEHFSIPKPGGSIYASCFKEGTLVSTSNGIKKIEDINKEDKILSYDHNKNQLVLTNVLHMLKHINEPNQSVELILENNDKLYVTANHSFYNPVAGTYNHLRDFNKGDSVFKLNNDQFYNEKIKSIMPIKKLNVVYNLDLDYPNNYFANGILVHNISKYAVEGCLRWGYETKSSMSQPMTGGVPNPFSLNVWTAGGVSTKSNCLKFGSI